VGLGIRPDQQRCREQQRLRHRRRRGRLLPPGNGASRVVGAPRDRGRAGSTVGGGAVTRRPPARAPARL